MESAVNSRPKLPPGLQPGSHPRGIGALLDHWTIQATFGFVLPMIFALGTALLRVMFVAPTDSGLAGYFVLFCWLLTVAFGLIFGFGVLTNPIGQKRSLPLAIALSMGTGLAGCSTLAFTAIAVTLLSAEYDWGAGQLMWVVLSPMPLATCIVYFRAASRSWAVSETRAASRPRWTVLAIAIGFVVLIGAIALACTITG